jgi:hypothetical protein
LQFIFGIIFDIFVKGAIKYESKTKNNNYDYTKTGVLITLILNVTIVITCIFNIDLIQNYFSIPGEDYKNIAIFGATTLLLDWVFYSIKLIYQYQDNNKKALKISVLWYTSKITSACIIGLLKFDLKTKLEITILVQLVIAITILLKNLRIKRIRLNIIEDVKYSMNDVTSNVFMAIIYIFGIHSLSYTSAALLSAYNIMTLCTDTQWDILASAVDTVTTIEVCKGNWEEKKKSYILNSLGYTAILQLSSIILIGLSHFIYKQVDFKDVWIMFILECALMGFEAIMCVLEAYLVIQYPTVILPIVSIILHSIRVFFTVTLTFKYTISIAVAISSFIGAIAISMIYFILRREKRELNGNRELI